MNRLLLRVFLITAVLACPVVSMAADFTDSFLVDGMYRRYIVHTPPGYSGSIPYPLVLNFHGNTSTAEIQQLYSAFDAVADTGNFIVAYPQGVSNTWNLFNLPNAPNDSTFVRALIDTLKTDYSVHPSRIYATGLSMGGFFSYILACSFGNEIAAIAPVAGNMADLTKNGCGLSHPMPVLHIHGDADAIVNYYGAPGIGAVPGTLLWWAQHNQCSNTPVITPVPDTDPGDNCTAETHYYAPGTSSDNAEVILIKVLNGGHTWPGAIPAPLLGNTCNDFNASALIWNFFNRHQLNVPNSIASPTFKKAVLYPNPAYETITVRHSETSHTLPVQIFDLQGRKVMEGDAAAGTVSIKQLDPGCYYLYISTRDGCIAQRFLKL